MLIFIPISILMKFYFDILLVCKIKMYIWWNVLECGVPHLE